MADETARRAATATSLPPELLSRIFEQHIQLCKESWGQKTFSERLPPSCIPTVGPYSWIRATHVCRYWRDVALTNPLLWSDIVLTCNYECVETMLARSRRVPLYVQSYNSCCAGDACPIPIRPLRLVLKHLPRIRSLTLYIKWWVYFDIVDTLRGPAPLLQQLTLSTPSGLYDTTYMQPAVLFPEHAPLTELTLCSFGFPWTDPAPFRALRSLRVVKGTPARPEVGDVLGALRHLPALRTLALEDVFIPSAPGLPALPAPPDVVALPALATLVLAGDAVACGTLLSGLVLPRATRITLNYHRTQCPHDLALALTAARAKFAPEPRPGQQQQQQRVEIEVAGLRCRLEHTGTRHARLARRTWLSGYLIIRRIGRCCCESCP
ncbi:uncharacterized protein PHACADRAFT_177934 [Phanerochaete carnosa HHB-10118-sp]|uniref:F-box domain-containing protein n=1 Tax=Phanerochaete carnosa (strain HHB-10118-sp) TaxID=650164 RepID=K5VWV5_PHACS|nr:uncharacterized protein PHACADRAFT_177934 [Phanerochaete carnosa HHB-10118-sp]EKM51280.1 hypothetical protein PHACADRAFT_177934 [Phanerochaete carnosa HHB-10118-sp]